MAPFRDACAFFTVACLWGFGVAAAIQLGMLSRVLADRSASDIGEITDLAVERAEQMELR